MATLDIFNDDAFSLVNLTQAFIALPEVPTRIGSLGVFEESGTTALTVFIEKTDEGLALVAETPRGGPGERVGGRGRSLVPVQIPHYQRDDAVMADEVQGVRAFGTESELETVQSLVDEKFARHGRAFDFTTEYQRIGALNGQVLDKTGAVTLDIFATFGLAAPAAIDFDLGNVNIDPRDKALQVLDTIEDAIENINIGQVMGLAGDTFFQKLVTHPKVAQTFLYQEASVLRGDYRNTPFIYGGIDWRRYHTRPKAKKALKGGVLNTPLIAANEARFIVRGIPGLYQTKFAPADYMETVNTVGRPRYAKQIAFDNDKGVRLEMQMNAISFVSRPEIIQFAITNT